MNRNRYRSRGMTPVAAAVAVLALGVSVSGMWWASGAGAGQDAQRSRTAAQAIQSAATTFRSQHGEGCPTLSSLAEERFLDRSVAQDDAWGNRFRVRCEDHQVVVVSAGPDQKSNTADDIRVPR